MVNNFEQIQQDTKNNVKTAAANQSAVDPKKRASKEGVIKTI